MASLCSFQTSTILNTAQSQLDLSSGLVQLIVARQRLMRRSEMLSTARCIISDLAEYGSPSMEECSRSEKINGLEIPVARCLMRY
jgi:hypothetical protein